MKKLIDECKNHDYIFLKDESVPVPYPQLKIVKKTVFACVHCGTGLDFYNLDEPIEIERSE